MIDRKADLQAIIDLFDQAEARIKRAEQLSSTITIPSVNELRYVGYHLTKALVSEDEKEFESQIAKATSHCQRAIYDANEIAILFLLAEIRNFQNDYANSTEVTPIVSNYVELLKSVTQAQRLISKAREGLKEDRAKYYQNTEPHFERLLEIRETLEIARPEINRRIKRQKFKDRLAVATLAISVALLLFAVAEFVDVKIAPQQAVVTEPPSQR